MIKECPACGHNATFRLSKPFQGGLTKYFQCESCNTLFCGPLPNDNMVGGGSEMERNTEQNTERLFRFASLTESGAAILDYGCGHGMLVADAIKDGFFAKGYDKFNPDFDQLPDMKFDLVALVECLEHLSFPFSEFDDIKSVMNPNAILYLESSFTDVAEQERIPLESFFYVSPTVGHATIFSHKGLDILMNKKGFKPMEHINRHVRIYAKM